MPSYSNAQPPGPDFLNAACEIETELSPGDLLVRIKRVEYDIGRRPAARWAPRPIDIDILLYGDHVIDDQTPARLLVVPHPLLAERNFVILPLAEIAPEVMHPLLGRAIGEIAEDADFDGLTHVAGPEWVAGEPVFLDEDEDG